MRIEQCTVIQSAAPDRPDWVEGCLASVQHWAARQGLEYRFLGDELFEPLPDWFHRKLAGRTPILADLARLLWMRTLHEAGMEWALWLDADTLVVDPDWMPVAHSHTVFGEECWLQQGKGRGIDRYIQPHNAFMLMHCDSPVRDFLIYASESIIARADPAHIAPQMVGPKLLKALNNVVGFTLEPAAGALSPELIQSLSSGEDAAAQPWVRRWPEGRSLAMANLCSSLPCDETARAALVAHPEWCLVLGQSGRVPRVTGT